MSLTARYVTANGTDTYANSTNSATPMSLTTAFANMAAADEIWIKAGSYTARSADTPTPDGTGVSPIVLHGYNSTVGDLDTPTYNTDGSLVTTNYPVIEYNAAARLNASGANLTVWRNLKIGVAGAGFSGAAFFMAGNSAAHQCYVYNPSTNAAATCITTGINGIVENCDLALTGASGGLAALQLASTSTRVFGNRIIDSQLAGMSISAAAWGSVIEDNVFFGAVVGPCIDNLNNNTTYFNTIRHNTAQGKAIFYQGAAFSFAALSYFGDNHITDTSTAAFVSLQDGTAQVCAWFSHNRFRDNVADVDGFDNWYAAAVGTVTTDTGGPATDYTDVATDQYRLIAGAPGVGTASVTNRDIGALQRTGGGAKSYAFSA